jgi:hypothetical protein
MTPCRASNPASQNLKVLFNFLKFKIKNIKKHSTKTNMKMKLFKKIMPFFLAMSIGLVALPNLSLAQTQNATLGSQGNQTVKAQAVKLETIKLKSKRAAELRARADTLRKQALKTQAEELEETKEPLKARKTEAIRLKTRTTKAIRAVKIQRQDLEKAELNLKEAKNEFIQDKNNLEKRKRLLNALIEMLIRHAEILKQRVGKIKVIDETLEASILAELDADIAKLEELKARVEAATTIEELKKIADELRQHRRDVYQTKIRRLMLLAHIGVFEHYILKTASERADKIEKLIDWAEKQSGKKLDELREILENARVKIENAHNQLLELKKETNSEEISDVKLKEIRASLVGVRLEIKEIYQLFRQIIEKVRVYKNL